MPASARGCGTCARVCLFSVRTVQGTSVVDATKCMGCGVCVDTCPSHATSLVLNQTGRASGRAPSFKTRRWRRRTPRPAVARRSPSPDPRGACREKGRRPTSGRMSLTGNIVAGPHVPATPSPTRTADRESDPEGRVRCGHRLGIRARRSPRCLPSASAIGVGLHVREPPRHRTWTGGANGAPFWLACPSAKEPRQRPPWA